MNGFSELHCDLLDLHIVICSGSKFAAQILPAELGVMQKVDIES